jgi:hypothetical protein
MCITIGTEDYILMACDSRLSVKGKDGEFYATEMEVDKIRKVKGKLIFGAGTMALFHEMCDRFEKTEGDSIYILQSIAREVVKEYLQQGNSEYIRELEYNSRVSLAVASFVEGLPEVYLLDYRKGHELDKADLDEQLCILGENIPKITACLEELSEDENYESITDIIAEAYNRCSGNYAGGTLSIYHIDNNNIATLVRQQKIIDLKEVMKLPEECIEPFHNHLDNNEGLKPYVRVGIGIIADAALGGLGKLGKFTIDNAKAGKFVKISEEQIATTLNSAAKEIKPTLINSSGTFRVKNTAVDNAVKEYNTAVETIQKHFKTNQLRAEDIPKIKAELGIDFNNILKNMINAEKGVGVKEIGIQRNLANAAGIKNLPNIKAPTITPRPLSNINSLPIANNALKPIVDAPKIEVKGLRSLPNTIINSKIASPELKAGLKKLDLNYNPLKNNDTLQNAKKLIDADYDQAVNLVKNGPATAESNAVGMELVGRLQKENRYTEAIDIIETISKKATESGQAIQALSMWGRLTPEGMLKYTQSMFDKANNELTKQGFKDISKLKLTEDLAKDITERMKAIGSMTEGRAKTVEIAKVLRDIDEQLPKSVWQKVSTVQTMAQLLNPKTMIRNIAGNSIFGGLENVSNVVGAPIDKVISKLTGNRTTILPSLKTQLEAGKVDLVEAVQDALMGIDTKGIGNKFELGNGPTFKGNTLLGKLEKGMNVGLKATDAGFSGAARAESLRQQMKIAGVTEPTPGMIEIADRIAKYKTFQDNNHLSNGFKSIKDGLNRLSGFFTGTTEWGLGDLVLKYAKTPANILARGIDYSPVGTIKAINEAVKPLRGKVFNQKEFVDALSRSATGTGLIVLGYQLNKMGLITGAADKDYDVATLQRDIGKGEYKLNTTALGRYLTTFDQSVLKPKAGDTYSSWDWAAPTSIMLGVGANISQNKGNTSDLLTTLVNATASGMNTIFEQPLLSGVQRFTGGYDQTQNLVNTLQTLPSSFTPSLLNQTKQLTDNTTRNTYDPSIGKETLNKVKARIPGLANTLQPRITTLGKQKETYKDGSNSLFNVLLNPSNTSKYDPTPGTEMILDIYEKSGEKIQFPRIAMTYVMVKGEKINLLPDEVTKLQTIMGEKTAKAFDQIAMNRSFRASAPEAQAKKLQSMLTEISQDAKQQILRDILKRRNKQ